MSTTIHTPAELKSKIFDTNGGYTENKLFISEFLSLDLPQVGSGLTGGSHGTAQSYTDHRWGGNVVRYCRVGWDNEKPSLEVID